MARNEAFLASLLLRVPLAQQMASEAEKEAPEAPWFPRPVAQLPMALEACPRGGITRLGLGSRIQWPRSLTQNRRQLPDSSLGLAGRYAAVFPRLFPTFFSSRSSVHECDQYDFYPCLQFCRVFFHFSHLWSSSPRAFATLCVLRSRHTTSWGARCTGMPSTASG